MESLRDTTSDGLRSLSSPASGGGGGFHGFDEFEVGRVLAGGDRDGGERRVHARQYRSRLKAHTFAHKSHPAKTERY